MTEESSPPCEGSCDPHRGVVRRVLVNGLHEWNFWYCYEAIAEDRRRGLSVRVLPADDRIRMSEERHLTPPEAQELRSILIRKSHHHPLGLGSDD